ncbi:hypothetical protein F383_26156 [Gossypium arboreum]|uniref:Uncharacterized protein n=1 Tax=Gossypium arboreum TaxID=29729 RepID=A0A0B0MIQ4_GOSAR|nr:hypothetical protein F383_26156 [Gossypium arboreum]
MNSYTFLKYYTKNI